ncbi:hypothetical protein QBC47DRAFT_357295 [Echria macrotheca]|uniref:Uncharacterized protein n=1 Tax=Echria macrotheca TaxID=438768 RepID=A0AAJ0BJP2_9PEZI|nr:hypothetical protein QBC47DRAFT_357295 [Echria macrotheca]
MPPPPAQALEAAAAPIAYMVLPRQQPTSTPATIPGLYGALDSSPDPGAVAGITLGAVGGFLLILFLIYTCINIGNPPAEYSESSVTGSVVVERKSKRHSSHRHHHHHRRSSRAEGERIEVTRTSRIVPETVIVEERVRGGAGPGGPVIIEEARRRPRSISRGPGGPRVVDLASDEDEVVVIEEHSPPPHRRRRSRVRSVERRSGAYSRRDSSSRG